MIYIFGDSFSAWQQGWPDEIGGKTFGSRGSSEYRIWRSYQENKHLISSNDRVVFCHTHYSRVFLKDSVKSMKSRLIDTHKYCDILFGDANSKADAFVEILEKIWDDEYFIYQYEKVLEDCRSIPNSTHITFFPKLAMKYDIMDMSNIYNGNRGERWQNHMTLQGNKIVAQELTNVL